MIRLSAKNRRVLITGATDGIGRQMAECYRAAGAGLVLVGRKSLE
ncbi:MAG: hypothetical protein AAF492_26910 [Verrucomicrobiota bacterium]